VHRGWVGEADQVRHLALPILPPWKLRLVTVVGRSGSFVAMFSFPRTVLSLVQSTEQTQVQVAGCARDEELIPLLADHPTHDGRATACVCEGYACQNPATEPGDERGS
jgi:uncharacterized protein